MTRVAFLGLGEMGGPMAARVVAAGHDVVLFDPVAAAVDARSTAATRIAASPADAAAGAEVVCVVVRDDAQSIDAVDGPDGVLRRAEPGAVLLLHATVAPATVRFLVTRCRERGVQLVDAGISGGKAGAERGTLYVMCGGDADAIERARPVIDTYAAHVVRFGDNGAGMAAKLARNLMHYEVWSATHDAMAVAEAAGLDLRAFEHLVRESSVAELIGMQLAKESTAAFDPEADPVRAEWVDKTIRLGWKDLDAVLALVAELGGDPSMARVARERYGPSMGLDRFPEA